MLTATYSSDTDSATEQLQLANPGSPGKTAVKPCVGEQIH